LKRNPNSVASLIRAATITDPTIILKQKQLEEKNVELKNEVDLIKKNYENKYRSLKQEHEKIKKQYEEKINDINSNKNNNLVSSGNNNNNNNFKLNMDENYRYNSIITNNNSIKNLNQAFLKIRFFLFLVFIYSFYYYYYYFSL
jgi:regulator of protease activity HflC (stomatin/prohibitin superfamily)